MTPFEETFRSGLETFKTNATAERPLVITDANKPFMEEHLMNYLTKFGYGDAEANVVMIDEGEFISFTASHDDERIEISIKFTDLNGNVVVRVDTNGDGQ